MREYERHRINLTHISAIGASRRIDLSRISSIEKRRADSSGYGTFQLRAALSSARFALSRRWRIAAVVPLIAALGAWFVVPAYAGSYTYNFQRVNGLVSNGHVCIWTDKGTAADANPHYRCPVNGYNYAGDFVFHLGSGTGPATLYGYCINLEKDSEPGEVLSDTGTATSDVSYIVNNYFPAKNHAGALSANDEAAAVQLAIWGFTNGTLSSAHPLQGVPAGVVARAHAIYTDAGAHAAAWQTANSAHPTLSVSVSGSPSQLPGDTTATFTAHVGNPAGETGLTVTFHIAGHDTTVPVGSGDTASTTVTRTAGGTVAATATLNGYALHDGGVLIPNVRAQSMAHTRTASVSASGGASAVWTTPAPTAAPTPTPTAVPTPTPTAAPTPTPTAVPTPTPTAVPTPTPTAVPTPTPTPTPTITTTVSSQSGSVGAVIHDTVVIGGAAGYSGPVNASLYGPFTTVPTATSCTGTPVWAGSVTVNGNGSYTTSDVTLTAAGYYTYQETLPGHAGVAAVTSVCGVSQETTVVSSPTPTPTPTSGVQGVTITSGVLSVTTPSTGAGDGILRSTMVGLCLMLSGLMVVIGMRRNPHYGHRG